MKKLFNFFSEIYDEYNYRFKKRQFEKYEKEILDALQYGGLFNAILRMQEHRKQIEETIKTLDPNYKTVEQRREEIKQDYLRKLAEMRSMKAMSN